MNKERRASPALLSIGAVVRSGDGELRARIDVPAAHPLFEGHFPGAPVLPAVALLALVIEVAELAAGRALPLRGVPQARFRRPVCPGETLEVTLRAEPEGGHVRFRLASGAGPVGEGALCVEES